MLYLKEEVNDELYFWNADKHRSFPQVDFSTLVIKVYYKLMLSLLMSMIKRSQSTQCNKFVIPLQYLYLYNIFRIGVQFCMQINIKVSTSWHYCFWWKQPDMYKVPKIGSWQYFCNALRKKYCNCFLVLLRCKTLRFFAGFQLHVRCWVVVVKNRCSLRTLKSAICISQ